MITTLTGPNSFALKAKLHQLVGSFIKEHTDMALERLDGEEAAYDRIREALESMPFLSARKLVVLDIPSANKEFLDSYEQLIKNLPETTDVVIVEPKLDKRSSYYKYLQKNTEYQEFNELDELSMIDWLVKTAQQGGGELPQSVAKKLIEQIGLNQQQLKHELDKLLAYNPKITTESINLLTEASPQSTIFQLLDAAMAGDKARTLRLYQGQRASKVEPQQIIAMLTWQLHVLALIKTADSRTDAVIAKEARLSPFVISKSRHIAKNLSVSRVKELISELLALDIASKTTAIDIDDAVQTYLLGI